MTSEQALKAFNSLHEGSDVPAAGEGETDGWISVKDRLPEIIDDDCSVEVLVVGWKGTHPHDTIQYDICSWERLMNPEFTDYKGNKVLYGWNKRWWDTNPDLYQVHYWTPLPKPPQP